MDARPVGFAGQGWWRREGLVWGLLLALALGECALVRRHVAAEVAPAFPRGFDQAVYLHRADDALDLSRAAYQSATKAGLPALASESLIMQAHALAVGNEPSACGRALNAAEQAFELSLIHI